ncbi:MAG TPA: nuclear transport factor 2 family protein [Ilumatobacteraceae bacterium]|nr:nuclear transport factor 2 family protein [Ilumatobacteraceae bacterium]
MDLGARTAQLFDLFESQEFDGLDELLAAGATMKQNGNPEHDVTGLMAFVQGLKREGVRVQYSDVRRSVGQDFVVEQHVVTLTRPDGKSASTDVCVVVRFDDEGRIVRLDEYADSAVFATLYE